MPETGTKPEGSNVGSCEELALHYAQKNDELQALNKQLLEACKFAKAQIKKGSPKKALPILRAAIKATEKNKLGGAKGKAK